MARDWILAKLPLVLPTNPIPEFLDLNALSEHFERALSNLQETNFVQDAIWKDSFVMTGTLRTFYSAKSTTTAWQTTASSREPYSFSVEGTPQILRTPNFSSVEISFVFKTRGVPATTGSGVVSVVPDADGQWRIWTMRTIFEQIEGQASVDQLAPAHGLEEAHVGTNGAINGINDSGVNGVHDRETELNGNTTNGIERSEVVNGHNDAEALKQDEGKSYDVVIVGGGQAGLSTAGRLQALGVRYVILEKHAEVGDNWKTRYDSTRLHTIREFAHLPFERTFDSSYQEYLTKDDLAGGYKKWVEKYNINIWLSTTLRSGQWRDKESSWSLSVLRDGTESKLRASFVVFAVGANCTFPLTPSYADRDLFKGVALHSGSYTNAKDWTGKHGVVVGTANTAHDVAEDMLEAGMASVTMVQRSPTFVVPVEHYSEGQHRMWNEKIPTDVSDRAAFGSPAVVGRIMVNWALKKKALQEPERFEALEKVGFKLDKEGDMSWYLFARLGGHYMDVGASGKIANGQIKIVSDSLPVRYTPDGLECANGQHIPADVIVFCTGFVGNLRLVVADIFGSEVAGQLDDYWNLDDEGELKGAFKHSGHRGFFYCGGAIGQARFMSRFIALQIKLKLLGTPIPMYLDTPPRKSSMNKTQLSKF